MARTKATVRTGQPTFFPALRQRIENKNILDRRLRYTPFKIKRLLPQTKQVKVKKWPGHKKNECEAKIYLLYRKT